MKSQLLANRLKDRRDNLLNAVSQTQEAALDIFVIVPKNFVKFVEEFDLLLEGGHPSEVQLDKEQECQDAFAADNDVLVLQESHQSL